MKHSGVKASDFSNPYIRAQLTGTIPPALPGMGMAAAKIARRRKESPKLSLPSVGPFALPHPETEFRFCKERRWRFDFAWPVKKIALEVEGGVWTNGRHTRGAGFVADMDKYNEAACEGWRVVRVTPDTLNAPSTLILLTRLLT